MTGFTQIMRRFHLNRRAGIFLTSLSVVYVFMVAFMTPGHYDRSYFESVIVSDLISLAISAYSGYRWHQNIEKRAVSLREVVWSPPMAIFLVGMVLIHSAIYANARLQ